MSTRETTLLAGRVKQIGEILGRPLPPLPLDQPPPDEGDRERLYLLETARELFWNDLEWEKLTGEERLEQSFLTEMAFPGLLAFVRGLLLDQVQPDSPTPPRPRPDVVDDILRFLAAQVVAFQEHASCLEGEACEHKEAELAMTSRLVDLVLYHRLGLDPTEMERVDAVLCEG